MRFLLCWKIPRLWAASMWMAPMWMASIDRCRAWAGWCGLHGAIVVGYVAVVGAVALGATTGPARAQAFGANDAPFLNLMGDLEGPAGFGDVYDGVPFLPPADLEIMTIAQILAYQRDILEDGTVSSAVARYQFLHDTLLGLVERLNLHPDLVFDGEVQTFLARHLMDGCGFYNPDVSVDVLGNCLAGIWAALPLLSGPSEGRSAYDGVAGNKALVDPTIVRQVLADRFIW